MTHDETLYFLGGYVKDLEDMSAAKFAEMLKNVDMSDPDQAAAAGAMSNKLMSNENSRPRQPPPRPPLPRQLGAGAGAGRGHAHHHLQPRGAGAVAGRGPGAPQARLEGVGKAEEAAAIRPLQGEH